jgi:hypothetical protein
MRLTKQVVFSLTVVAMASTVAFAQQGKGGRGGFGFGGGGLPTLAANEAVQKDLGLSGDAVGKLTSLRDDYFAASQKENQNAGIRPQDFQNLSADERRAATEKMAAIGVKLNEEFTPKVKEILSADQFKRLKQIQVQAMGAGPALASKDVASELGLSADQTKKIADLNTEAQTKQRELSGDFQERFAKIRELNTERDSKAVEVLTADQKTKFTALKGSAFDTTQLGFGGRGGKKGKNN